MKLPKIYEHFQQGQIFTIEEARRCLGTTGNTLRKRLSDLAARGYIYPVRQGMYRVSRIGEAPGKTQASPYAIAAKLTPYCYLAYASALELHTKTPLGNLSTLTVVSPTKFNSFTYENVQYVWCQGHEPHGLMTLLLEDSTYEFPLLVSNPEKSLIDCLKRPSHSPSLGTLLDLCRRLEPAPKLDRLLTYAKDCQVAALYNRLGFLLESLQEWWDIPSEALQETEKHMSRKLTEWPIGVEVREGARVSTLANGSPCLTAVSLEGQQKWRVTFPHLQRSALGSPPVAS